MKILALLCVLVSCFFDPLQQVLLKGRYDGTVGWWHFHLVHWAAFYPALVWIVLRESYISKFGGIPARYVWRCGWRYVVKTLCVPVLAITALAWFVWRLGMYVSGAGWESFWTIWIKKALN